MLGLTRETVIFEIIWTKSPKITIFLRTHQFLKCLVMYITLTDVFFHYSKILEKFLFLPMGISRKVLLFSILKIIKNHIYFLDF